MKTLYIACVRTKDSRLQAKHEIDGPTQNHNFNGFNATGKLIWLPRLISSVVWQRREMQTQKKEGIFEFNATTITLLGQKAFTTMNEMLSVMISL